MLFKLIHKLFATTYNGPTVEEIARDMNLDNDMIEENTVIQWIDANNQLPPPKIDYQTKNPSKYWSIDVDVWIVEENGDEYRKSGIMYNYKQDCWNGTSPIMYDDERDEKLIITHWIPTKDFDKAIIPKGRR